MSPGGGLPVPAVAFVAWSGTGKTTLVEQIIALGTAQGMKIGALKHDAHEFEIDRPGKDSYRFSAAGAAAMVLVSAEKLAMVRRHDQAPEVDVLLQEYFTDMDLVLIEGWKNSALPRIEVHRPSLGQPLICRAEGYDTHLLAVASDAPIEVDVPVFSLEDPASILDFIRERFDLS